MAELTVYAFEDENGNEDTYTTMNPAEAREYASRYRRKLIARVFEYSDSELVEDFTRPDDDEDTDEDDDDEEDD